MQNDLLLTTRKDNVFTMVMNRPDQRNALDVALLNRLQAALEEADGDGQARVIVLAANGPVFCPGHDLKELTRARSNADQGRNFFEETMRLCAGVMQKIVNHRLPVIADIRGIATAAGCQLVASCDLAIATDTSKFATPGVNIGLFCSTPMVALSRNIPRKHAMKMLLTGEAVSAHDAVQLGLINQTATAGEIDGELEKLTGTIISKSGAILKIGKQAFYKQVEMPLAEAYDYTSRVMVENMMEHDAREGINAFIEKREPSWRDA